MKKRILPIIIISAFIFSGCSSNKPTDEELARQEIMETNIAQSPEWSEGQKKMIEESRGLVVVNEVGEGDEKVVEYNSFSPGPEAVDYLSSLTKEELLELDDVSKLEILINGIIRDEYTVAAHTMYGKSEVERIKKEFKDGLLDMIDPQDEGEEEFAYVDIITMRSKMNDRNVARHHVDAIIENLNRVYIRLIPKSNFGSKVSLMGEVYPVVLTDQLNRLEDEGYQFTGIEITKNTSDEEREQLNEYYNSLFQEALEEANISEEETWTFNVGGFEKREDGTWIPSQANIFSQNIVRLVYGIK